MSLEEKREAIVRAHVEAENRHDVEATLRTFDHARYEVVPFGGATEGAEAVHGLLSALMSAFPDFHADVRRLHHSNAAVIVETVLTGTQRDTWLGVPASGKRVEVPCACIFEFDEDRLICERVYFDNATMMKQITG